MRKTKIVCTIGPVSDSKEVLAELMDAGMNFARLNFSHGTHEEHARRIQRIHQVAEEKGKVVGILQDIQGPKIRIGIFQNEKILLKQGDRFTLTTENIDPRGTQERVFVNYPKLPRDVKPGNVIYLDDGILELQVVEVKGNDVVCEVIVGGELSSRKGVSLPGVDVDLPPLTDADMEDIKFGVEQGVDAIAASFVRRGEHIEAVKKVIAAAGGSQPVIAKIESQEGVRNIDDIIASADGVMVARGDMGVEMAPEEVPSIQKMIIRKCNMAGKPVITATQMLDSMIRNPRPTRAEVTDVANAILDGTDAVMLSGETAVGKYPVCAVKMMHRIAAKTETSLDYPNLLAEGRKNYRGSITEAISYATCMTAEDIKAAAIICSTQSGVTARMVSKYRPRSAIIAVTPYERVVRRLAMVWGVYPILVPRTSNIDSMLDVAVKGALESGLVHPEDTLVIAAGVRTGTPGATNLLQVIRVE